MWSLNKYLLTTVYILISWNICIGQHLDFSKLDLIDKKLQVNIDHIVYDGQGFLWLGTDNGLFMSDGIVEKQYLPSDNESTVVGAMMLKDSLIYLGWNNGFFSVFNIISKTFIQVEFISDQAINQLLIDDKDRIWISTKGDGIYLKDKDRLSHYTINFGLADNYVNDLIFNSSTQEVWAATDRGLSRFVYSNDTLIVEKVSTLSGNIITALALDSLGTLWAGTYSGIIIGMNVVYDNIENIFPESTWDPGLITCLEVIDNDLWIGTQKNGIGIFEIYESRFRFTDSSGINEAVHDIIYDGNSRVLLSTESSSVFYTDKRFLFISRYDQVSFKDAGVVSCDNQGKILFSNEVGLYSFSPMFDGVMPVEKIFDLKTNNVQYIISLYIDDSDRIWIGTFGQGLWMIDGNKLKHFTEKDGLSNNNVLSISGRGNEIWMGTLGGASMLNYSDNNVTFKKFGTSAGLKSQYVYSVFVSKNDVWFGTDGSGLIKYSNGEFITVASNDHMANVYSVVGSGREIWFTSQDGHLNKIVEDTIISYQIKYNDHETEISTLVTINDDHLYYLSEYGVGMFDKKSNQYIVLDEEYGLKPFNYNYLNTLCADEKGNIWIGSETFMLNMRMQKHNISLVPQTYISSVELFSDEIDTNIHEFDASENHFIFNYSGLWYHDPLKVRFKYRLKGFDINWKETKDTEAIYQKLPPGSYTFEVGSTASANFESISTASYSFKINKPLYYQWWFMILVLSLLYLLVYLIIKWNNQKKIRKAQDDREKILTQFELLKSQVNPHFLFNSLNTLNALIFKNSTEASDFLLKLSDYMRYLLTQNENTTHSLGEELKLVTDYAYLQKRRFGDNLLIEINLSEELRSVSLIPPLTIQILLENAIKHNVISRSKPLVINIYQELDHLVIKNNLQEIKDNIESTGIGLSNITSRYRILFKKEIEIDKSEDFFIVKLPIILNDNENITD